MTPETARTTYEHLACAGPAGLADILPSEIEDAYATIAAQTWEYGVEQDNPMCNHIEHGADPTRCRTIAWAPDEATARSHAAMPFRRDRHPRVVRRPVGPVEVVEA